MVFTQHSVFLQKHHGITIVHFYQHVPCIHFHMFPFLFAHTPSEHQICACVSKCVGVYLCVSGKRRVSVSEALLTQFVRQQKTLHCFFDYATFPPLLPVDPFTAAWRWEWFTFLLLNHVWLSQRALSSLCPWRTGGSFLFGDLAQSVTIWDPQISIHRAWISRFRTHFCSAPKPSELISPRRFHNGFTSVTRTNRKLFELCIIHHPWPY